jgi:adenylate cyclase
VSGVEIERKFLLAAPPAQLAGAPGIEVAQGYLALGEDGSEVRLRRAGQRLTLTAKRGRGMVRGEAEIELEPRQFELLWPLTEGRRLTKVRHRLALEGGLVAEVDVYGGGMAGLVVGEVEFPDEAAARSFSAPAWLGDEVTGDDRYSSRVLATEGPPTGVRRSSVW